MFELIEAYFKAIEAYRAQWFSGATGAQWVAGRDLRSALFCEVLSARQRIWNKLDEKRRQGIKVNTSTFGVFGHYSEMLRHIHE